MSRAPNIFLAVSILSVFISTVVEISFVYILHPANRTASRRVARATPYKFGRCKTAANRTRTEPIRREAGRLLDLFYYYYWPFCYSGFRTSDGENFFKNNASLGVQTPDCVCGCVPD